MIGSEKKTELGIGPTCAIRKGDYKLIYWYETGKKELYDIPSDISESHDISNENPTIVESLSTELGNYLRSVDAQRPSFRSDNGTITPCPWPDGVE